MLGMPSLLESRHRLLNLWTFLEREQIQPTYRPMTLDILSIPNYVIKKGRPHDNPWED